MDCCPSVSVQRPGLDPVTPSVAQALDEFLIDIENPEPYPFVIFFEEFSGGEEQEIAPAASEPPTIYLDSPADHPGVCCKRCSASSDWRAMVRDVMDALRRVASVEVEGPVISCRARCQLHLGFACFRGSLDRDGHGYFEFGIGIPCGERPDLRAAQRDHDEKVARWIELKSGSGTQGNPSELYELEDDLWP
jgi:hypothetical protein